MTDIPANPRASGQLEREARLNAVAADADVQAMQTRLRTGTAAQIDEYIEANITSVPDVRRHLKALSKTLALLLVAEK